MERFIDQEARYREFKQPVLECIIKAPKVVQYVYQNMRKAVIYNRGNEIKWAKTFSIELKPNFWKEAYSNNFKCCTETLLRPFQYSILLHTLPTNSYLFKCCFLQNNSKKQITVTK